MRNAIWLLLLIAAGCPGAPAPPAKSSQAPAEVSPGTGDLVRVIEPSPLGVREDKPSAPEYEVRSQHDPNGIGKFYMGREIAHVISGPQATAWLERPEREQEEDPTKLVRLLDLKAGDAVADIGAGTGYLSFRIAPLVRKVFAEEIQEEMLAKIRARARELGIQNVEAVLGTIKNPNLPPASVDLVLLVDVYHEFEFPFEMMLEIRRALKPEGRVALVEYRGEDPRVPIKEVHKMTQAQARREMEAVSYSWIRAAEDLPWQRVMFFAR